MYKNKIIFTDFCLLNKETLLKILEQRNSDYVRKWMDNDKIISINDHLNFCKKLKNNNYQKHIYVTINDAPYGVINFKAVNNLWNSCEGGCYTFNNQKIPMGHVNAMAIQWMQANFGIQKIFCKIKANNLRALLPYLLKPDPTLKLIKKDTQFYYFMNELELTASEKYVNKLAEVYNATTVFNILI